MQEKASQEFLCGEGHQPLLVAVGVILPAESYLAFGKADKAVIGDGHAMRVARQIMQYMLGAAEGRLGIDYPVVAKECAQERVKGFALCQWPQRAGQTEIPFLKRLLQPGDEFAAEHSTEDFHGQQEGIMRLNPTFMVRGQATGRDYTMDMGMVQQVRPPGVEHA